MGRNSCLKGMNIGPIMKIKSVVSREAELDSDKVCILLMGKGRASTIFVKEGSF